jgi:peptidoglycan-associated lipoprotein
MRKKIFGCIIFLCFGALMSAGCAKKEIVKKEEPIPAVQPAPPAPREAVKPAPETTPEPVKSEQVPSETAVKPEPAKEMTAGEMQNELQKIYFNFDSAALSDEARSTLSKDADVLAKNGSLKIRIEGNCDERGSDEYNMALGERRAKAARDYLVNLGIQPDRLSIISYGEEKPVDPGHDEAAWAKNRRDEFVIVK